MRYGRAVSAKRTPVRPPAPTTLVSLTPAPKRTWTTDARPAWRRALARLFRRRQPTISIVVRGDISKVVEALYDIAKL
jgi:hypothetical protein